MRREALLLLLLAELHTYVHSRSVSGELCADGMPRAVTTGRK